MKTKVFLTIDTEFSIAGAFADPVAFVPVGEQAVLCQVGQESHGLGFLLSTFQEYGIPATFFVEAFNAYYFGDAPMRDLALRIKAAGHDVQLHLHPCWTYFKNRDWVQELAVNPPTDHMNGRSLEQVKEWLGEGIAIFERWGLGRPIALRTGSLNTDRTVYQAMEEVGLKVGSNIALGVHVPEESDLHLYSGLHQIGQVLEACVLTYVDRQVGGRPHYRALTVTGASWAETRSLLLRAHAANVESVVVLTHPFEFVKYDAPGFTNVYRNRINQRRLRKLCAFLAENKDHFEVATVGQLASGVETSLPRGGNALLRAPWPQVVGRMLENALNDRIKSL